MTPQSFPVPVFCPAVLYLTGSEISRFRYIKTQVSKIVIEHFFPVLISTSWRCYRANNKRFSVIFTFRENKHLFQCGAHFKFCMCESLRRNLVPIALVTLVQRSWKTKTFEIMLFISTFHSPLTEGEQSISNKFVPRFPIPSRARWMCKIPCM